MTTREIRGFVLAAVLLVGMGRPAARVEAHCDTMDGPVVKAAQVALEKGDVTGVLKWVQPGQEAEIRAAFDETLAVRALGKKARDLADKYFFETLVRVHREGEGAPYTGLKPAGTVEPVIAASDKALETGSVEDLTHRITQLVAEGIRHRFAETLEKQKHAEHNVAAGREFVAAYVEFVHYVERLHADALGQAGAHAGGEKPAEETGHRH